MSYQDTLNRNYLELKHDMKLCVHGSHSYKRYLAKLLEIEAEEMRMERKAGEESE